MKKIDNQVVNSQPDDGNQKELSVFDGNVRVGAVESPNSIPKIVVGSRKDETKRVGNVFVPAKLLLA